MTMSASRGSARLAQGEIGLSPLEEDLEGLLEILPNDLVRLEELASGPRVDLLDRLAELSFRLDEIRLLRLEEIEARLLLVELLDGGEVHGADRFELLLLPVEHLLRDGRLLVGERKLFALEVAAEIGGVHLLRLVDEVAHLRLERRERDLDLVQPFEYPLALRLRAP